MNFSDLWQRAEFISLQTFLKSGCESFYPSDSDKTYSERLTEASEKLGKFFDEKFPKFEDNDKVWGYFYEQACVFEEVYFEIGVILGAKIGYQFRGRVDELS